MINLIKIFHFIQILIILFVGDHLVILGGRNVSNGGISDVELLDMQNDGTGCNPTDLPTPVYRHASVYSSVLQSIITCGGWEKYRTLSTCTVQKNNGHQISLPSMNSKRSHFAMVAIGNQLISIGGWQSRNTMETIKLNATGTWNQQSIPFSARKHCAVALDNNIIVIGGLEHWNVS